MKKHWHLTARPTLSLTDRLRLLLGVPLYVRFLSPDGDCHAACDLEVVVQRTWPAAPCLPHAGSLRGCIPFPPPFPPNREIAEGEHCCAVCGSGQSTHEDGSRNHSFNRRA